MLVFEMIFGSFFFEIMLINFFVEKLVGGDGGELTSGGSVRCGGASRIRKFQESNEIDQGVGTDMRRRISTKRRLGI